MRESSLKANAQSSTSSAAGLFQFVDQTWLGLVKTHGAKYGLGSLAGAINVAADGRYHTSSDSDRQTILALKKDPQISALMAGGNMPARPKAPWKPIWVVPFVAVNFMRRIFWARMQPANWSAPARARPPSQRSAGFPQAAGANRNVFFHADGTAKSVREVYDWAMQQPGSAAPVASAAPADVKADFVKARTTAAHAVDANIETLLAGVMNWQPAFQARAHRPCPSDPVCSTCFPRPATISSCPGYPARGLPALRPAPARSCSTYPCLVAIDDMDGVDMGFHQSQRQFRIIRQVMDQMGKGSGHARDQRDS